MNISDGFVPKRLEALQSATLFLAAVEKGRVLGFAALHPGGASSASSHVVSLRIHVSPEAQSQGVGTRLMEEILTRADHGLSGIRRIVATPYIPEPEDFDKVAFFGRFGFKVEGFGHKAAWLLDGHRFTDIALMARVT